MPPPLMAVLALTLALVGSSVRLFQVPPPSGDLFLLTSSLLRVTVPMATGGTGLTRLAIPPPPPDAVARSRRPKSTLFRVGDGRSSELISLKLDSHCVGLAVEP